MVGVYREERNQTRGEETVLYIEDLVIFNYDVVVNQYIVK
jgi:hypothetical protein